jgi:predicted N-acetyltransferase YhbS
VTTPVIRPLRESEVGVADRIFRIAFGTFVGLPDPMAFGRQADIIGSRWRSDPGSVLAAEQAGEIVGSNCLINWGSVGLFGPLTVRPDLWDRGVAKRLLEPTMERFGSLGSTHLGLFTFPKQPQAPRPLSEVRLLAPKPDRRHDEASGAQGPARPMVSPVEASHE